ncbi:GLE1-domain-containing protein [Atractiella rhizophila]|nr:GLE1-domain-containing protein [Atractiella rhizophila]
MRFGYENQGIDSEESEREVSEVESVLEDTFANRHASPLAARSKPGVRKNPRLEQVIRAGNDHSRKRKLAPGENISYRIVTASRPSAPPRPTLRQLLSDHGIYRMPDSDDDPELELDSSDDDRANGRRAGMSDSDDDSTSSEEGAEVEVSNQQKEEEDWSLLDEYYRKSRPPSNVILHVEEDPWDTLEKRGKQESFERAMAKARTHQANMRRAAQVAKEKYQTERLEKERKEMEELGQFMRNLELERKSKEEVLNKDYELRNKQLWDEIDAAIAEHEKMVAEQAAAEARYLAERRLAEEKAKAAREAEEARIKAEKDAKEKKDREDREAAQKAQEAQTKAKQAAEEEARKKKAAQEAMATGNKECRAEFLKWRKTMDAVKRDVLAAVKQDPALLKACQQAKREMRPKIGQLTNSAQQIARITKLLHDLLESSKTFNSNVYIFCLNTLSKLLINQVNVEAKTEALVAYPLAKVVIGLLLLGHVELGNVLMARLNKKCFWICGYFPKKPSAMEDAVYSKMLGQVEGEDKLEYQLRMASFVTFYAAICQTLPAHVPIPNLPPSAAANVPPHFRPSAAWKFIVNSIDKPMSAYSPTALLLHSMLETAGTTLMEVYGRQFQKLLELLFVEGLEGGKSEFPASSQGLNKLRYLLNDIKTSGKVPQLDGRVADP